MWLYHLWKYVWGTYHVDLLLASFGASNKASVSIKSNFFRSESHAKPTSLLSVVQPALQFERKFKKKNAHFNHLYILGYISCYMLFIVYKRGIFQIEILRHR